MEYFFCDLFELWGLVYLDVLSDDLCDRNIYFPLFLFLLIASIITPIFYYWIRDRTTGNTIINWLFYGSIGALVALAVSGLYIQQELLAERLSYAFVEYIPLLGIVFVYYMMLFTAFSFLIRLKSTNRRGVPI